MDQGILISQLSKMQLLKKREVKKRVQQFDPWPMITAGPKSTTVITIHLNRHITQTINNG